MFEEIKITGISTAIDRQQKYSASVLKSKEGDSLCLEAESFEEKQNLGVSLTKDEANDTSPATPKSKCHVNNSFLSNNSLLYLNKNVDSPLGASTPVKVSLADIQGFQTSNHDNHRSKLPFYEKTFYKVTSQTKIYVNSEEKKFKNKNSKDFTVTFESVGGLKKQIDALKEIIQLPLMSPQVFASYGEFSFSHFIFI